MSGRVIIPDSPSDDSDESIPSPSPFSPEYRAQPPARREQSNGNSNRNEAIPPAKRQRVSVLEQYGKQETDGADDEILSEPNEEHGQNNEPDRHQPQQSGLSVLEQYGKLPEANEQTRNGQVERHDRLEESMSEPTNSSSDSRDAFDEQENHEEEDNNSRSDAEREGASTNAPPSVSDEDRKLPAKQTSAPTRPATEQTQTKGDAKESEPMQPATEKTISDAKESENKPKDEVVSEHVNLEPIPSNLPPLEPLSHTELLGLKLALHFSSKDHDNEWPTEWSGNVDLFTKEVANPLTDEESKGDERPLIAWASTSPHNLAIARILLRYVYNEKDTPPTAKKILAHAYHASSKDMQYDMDFDIKRLSFDPCVLREDGWTTAKSSEPVGATGGPHHIGARVVWQRWEGVVIAYLHDEDIGDLWKAMWLDGNETFDLEAGELVEARKKWDRKNAKEKEKVFSALPSARFASAAKFTVEGIENGIIMAKSYDPRARQGLYWPARVMHASEVAQLPQQSRRSSSKQKLNVFFLAPYWNGTAVSESRFALADTLSLGSSAFSSGPLVERDVVEISEETIQPYPYRGENGLNIDELQAAFKFTGLPKNAFARFLDSHRLALALKMYARQELSSESTHSHAAAAALTDTHPMANEAPMFPPALLHLPFQYILSKLPHAFERASFSVGQTDDTIEPTIQLGRILKSMEPPACWGQDNGSPVKNTSPSGGSRITPALSGAQSSPSVGRQLPLSSGTSTSASSVENLQVQDVASEYLIQALSQACSKESIAPKLLDQAKNLLDRLKEEVASLEGLSISQRRKKLLHFLKAVLRTKGQGEDVICSEEFDATVNTKSLETEWRKACENIFRRASVLFSCPEFGNATTYVISDSRCNEHITSTGCVERPVRLPAALKGARLAGREPGRNVDFLLSVGDDYMTLAETKIIGMAHSGTYLKRMRAKCAAIKPGVSGQPLTDDSNFEGGEDTKGSRGSYTAAVAGVAAAIKAVDMIVGGRCVNAFCATRPPGHHAGRELHPMKAISNGFCILNNAACAALYATMPISENGPGLKRVCVIDIDVHHGNGTQNILCDTYDPRFLYISLHAGGSHINGHENDDDNEYRAIIGSQDKQDAIFPGRCGDTSPHKGVLNIPLGARVKPQDLGMALASHVSPAVAKFAPDLIIVSAGFDAHKHDPLGMGGLSAEDFGHATDVICSMASKCCSGRVLSVLEGGYGVPCCRPQKDLFLPQSQDSSVQSAYEASYDEESEFKERQYMSQQPQVQLLDLGSDLPDEMDDQVPQTMHKALNRCHAEGFVDCVREHVGSLAKSNNRST